MISLIKKQFERGVKEGDVAKLAQFIREYEYSSKRNEPISSNILQAYFCSLLILGKFVQLQLAVKRNEVNEINEVRKLMREAAQAGKEKKFQELIKKANEIEKLSKCQLKIWILPSAKFFVLKQLSKCYINIEKITLFNNYQISQEDFDANGFSYDSKFVYFRQNAEQINIDEFLRKRVNQVSEITQNVIKKGAI